MDEPGDRPLWKGQKAALALLTDGDNHCESSLIETFRRPWAADFSHPLATGQKPRSNNYPVSFRRQP